MTFADLVTGDAVFVDANTLTYHFEPHAAWGPPCSDLRVRKLTALSRRKQPPSGAAADRDDGDSEPAQSRGDGPGRSW